ncbi:MAG TPA: histidine phosphatase family protein [Candidatus Limnocylindrales bacterium]
MLTLILTRHGQAASADVMLGGQLDVPLTPTGRHEAEALGRRLASVRIDRIVSSPLLRALETAQTVATGRPVEVDERLRELDYGQWESLTYEEIEARDPALRARWDHDPGSTHSPGGESGEDVAARALSFLVELLEAEMGTNSSALSRSPRSPDPGGSRGAVSEAQAEAEGERRVLVVAHGTFNRILLCVAVGIPVSDYRRRFVQDRTNLTALRYERDDTPDGAQLILSNDVGHLRSKGETPWG